MNTLYVEKLRGISHLEFPIPANPGTMLLTGSNGAGKSTVLSALARLGDPEVLNRHFTPDIQFTDSRAGDVFADSLIRFSGSHNSVDFHFSNGCWQPESPEAETAAFQDMGYKKVIFTARQTKYIPKPDEEFSVKNIHRAPDDISDAAARIFDAEKFHHLYTIYSEGARRNIFLIHRFSGGQDFYFSENNFSSGERAFLRLAAMIPELPSGSLVLIDEAEMALHPKSASRMMEYLDRVGMRNGITFLVSTQSASLIKVTDPRKILFLENDEYENMVCRTNVYPAAVLGEMAIADDILPEIILLVEDQEAAFLLEAIVEKLKQTVDHDFPYSKILPVGGYMQVVILLDNLSKVFPDYVKRRAVLDQDAEPCLRKTLDSPSRPHFDVVARNRKQIYFLPCAPEQGVIELLEEDPPAHSKGISNLFGGHFLRLYDVFHTAAYHDIRGTSRSDCKEKLSMIVYGIKRITGESESFIRKKLYRYYADNRYEDPQELKKDYCSLIFRR